MANEAPICIRQDQLDTQSRKITELETRADYKEQKIADLDKKIDKMDKKIDKLSEDVNDALLKSVSDDNSINQRVTALESSQSTTRWLIGIGFTIVGTAIAILALIVSVVH